MVEPLTEDEKDFGAIVSLLNALAFHAECKGDTKAQRYAEWGADRLCELYQTIYGPNRPIHEGLWIARVPHDRK